MAGIGVVLNRNAGKKTVAFRGQVGEKLGFVLGDPDSLRETSRIEQIEDVIHSFRERQIDVLGISGGDGSNHYVLDTCHRVYGDAPLPRIAFLCGGTHNAHALSIGVRGTPEKLLQNIMRKYHTRARFDLTHRVLMRVDDGVRVHTGFSLGAGFLFRFYEELVMRQDDSPAKVAGLLAAWIGSFLTGGKRIAKIFELEPARVELGGQELGWTMCNGFSASSMEKLGLGFTPYPRASETPTTFQAGALRIKTGAFLKLMWAFRRGVVPLHPDFHSDITDRAVIEAERPISYVFDGELFRGSERLEVSVARRIELIVG
jgi:diacylglycerol kinase family enzyme